jgi:hypothetical protein
VSKCIRFDRTNFDSKGRNGYIGTSGINVVDLGEELSSSRSLPAASTAKPAGSCFRNRPSPR